MFGPIQRYANKIYDIKMIIDKIFKNSVLNALSGIAPFFFFIALTPKTLEIIGLESFGVYSILCSIILIVGSIDFGVSRTFLLNTADDKAVGLNNNFDILRIAKNLLHIISTIYFILGLVFITVIIIDGRLSSDITAAAIMTLIGSIATLETSTHRSILEVNDRFVSLNLIRTAIACFLPLAPLLPVFSVNYPLSSALFWVALSRCVGAIVYISCTNRHRRPAQNAPVNSIKKSSIIKFINRSKYVGVTNILSLVMTYSDRFLIASFVSIAAMANYVIAYDTVTKVWLVMGALSSAVLPRLAAENRADRSNLNDKSVIHQVRLLIVVACIAPCVAIGSFANVIFELWLGTTYNAETSTIAMFLALGVALNCMTQLNFNLLQINGGERHGVALQIINLSGWGVLCLAIVPIYGVLGAAAAFLARMILDSVLVARACKKNNVSNIGFSRLAYIRVILLFTVCAAIAGNL